ncbi:MAG TPA: rod shape-determining protein MreC [Prolixibacteraceae bacterium]|nr:rod shape-determining protein MreC [Prolixibacteraceae bacterium]
MRNLIHFLYRYHAFLLFLVLEALCFTLMIRYNNYQGVRYFQSSNRISGFVYAEFDALRSYFSLRKINEELAIDNANLRSRLLSVSGAEEPPEIKITADSTNAYRLLPAKVINNSVNKQYNYLTLDKGARDGVKPDMGIVCANGIVGVVVNTSERFSTALSLLNSRWSVNAKLSRTHHFGPLHWEGENPYVAVLNEIPYHVGVQEDDEVVTSGFSTLFPEGILIGKVVRVEHKKGETFQTVWVQLSTDFKNLHYVGVVINPLADEQKELEKTTINE